MKAMRVAFWVMVGGVLLLGLFAALRVGAATNISATSSEHFAWDDTNGWWDIYATNSVTVYSTRLTGYASSSVGDMSLDCSTTASGNICGSSNYGICNGPGPKDSVNLDGTCDSADADSNGLGLTGYAWNDTVGWISFNCNQISHGGSHDCASSNYAVKIDSNGNFYGYAWNDVAGWVSFSGSGYKVVTSWRATSTFAYVESSVFDTSLSGGGVLQSIIWQGTQPSGTSVDFQIATSSSSSGPWTFYGPSRSTTAYHGTECPFSGISVPGAGSDKAICVDKNIGAARYLRYKVRLRSTLLQTLTPTVEDVILIWSK